MSIRRKWAVTVSILLALALLAGAFGCGRTADRGKADSLVVSIIDVGQGDAILIRSPGQVTLVDTGDVPTRGRLIGYIRKQGITVIDNLIITHPHSDHIGGAAAVLENFTVKRVYDSGQSSTSLLYRNYLTMIQKRNIPFAVVTAGQRLDISGGATLNVFGPDTPFISGTESDLNNNSIFMKLTFGDFSMLLPGDAELEAEQRVLGRFGGELKSTVLKSGHHGSRTSSSLSFLKAVNPEVVIISAGVSNEYHHPHPSTMQKYNEFRLQVYRTDRDGTVIVTSDGKNYTITKEKP